MQKGEIQWAGFWLAGLLCVVLAVVKLSLALPWTWWWVLLPLGVVLWHNTVYIAVGFIWLAWRGSGREGDDLRSRRRHTVDRYQVGNLVCAATFLDNVLRSGWNDVLVLSAGLMLACQFLYWSGIGVGGQNEDS
jgi:hypothetical protein